MKYLYLIFVFLSVILHVTSHLFDRCSGKKVEDVKYYDEKKVNKECSIEVKPCTPHEGSRIDGTCNNYRRPTRGAARGPYLRLLNPDYGDNGSIRKNRNGKPLPSARKVRTYLQSTGRVVDKVHFNTAAVTFLDFINRDISALSGPLDYLRKRQYCCEEKGKADYRCEPIYVPEDDPYLRVTDMRCLNFSRAETFFDVGCTPKEMDPQQINFQTPLLDLSTIYGVDEEALSKVRKYEYGLLKEERRGDRDLPLNDTRDVCFQNRMNNSVCYKFGFSEVGNLDLRTTTLTIFFINNHNRLARILHELNPCWKDDRLFKVARQINIATASNIFLYELLPQLLGHKHMVDYGLISEHVDYVTAYDEDAEPLVFAEYEIARRYFRTFLDGRINKYSEKYHYVGEFSYSDTLLRQELIEKFENYEEINRGTFYQHAAKIDDIQDPDISEKFYGEIQKAADLPAIDIQRGRDLGLQGYNGYRKLCGLRPAKHFEDLLDVMSIEKMEALKKLYHDIEDIDLLAGIMSENLVQGTFIGPTLFCIMSKQVFLMRFADRFWFERGKQYHSFTPAQLHEVRKTNMARFACDNADGIKFIQPQALLNVGHGNQPVPCSHIPGPDTFKWYDDTCRQHDSHKNYHYPEYHTQHRPSYQQVDFYGRELDYNHGEQHKKPHNDNRYKEEYNYKEEHGDGHQHHAGKEMIHSGFKLQSTHYGHDYKGYANYKKEVNNKEIYHPYIYKDESSPKNPLQYSRYKEEHAHGHHNASEGLNHNRYIIQSTHYGNNHIGYLNYEHEDKKKIDDTDIHKNENRHELKIDHRDKYDKEHSPKYFVNNEQKQVVL